MEYTECERKIDREIYDKLKCLEVLFRDYTAVFYADFNEDVARPFKVDTSANIAQISDIPLHGNLAYTDTVKRYCRKYVADSCKAEFEKILSREHLQNALKQSERCVYRYESIPTKEGFHYFEVDVIRVDEKNFQGNGIIAFRKIDEIVLNENLQQKRILELSFIDSLTGLGNRHAFSKALEKWKEHEFAYISIDVNNLKLCNDRYGQQEGDYILTDIAMGLKVTFKGKGAIYRIGGDEFGILMKKGDREQIHGLMEQVTLLLAEKNSNHLMNISLAWGYALSCGEESPESVINRGNERMYDHKRRMKMEFSVYREEKIKDYLTVSKILNKSTDDYLFIWDMGKDEFWYCDEVNRHYAVHDGGKIALTIADLEKFVHPADWDRLREDLMECCEAKKEIHNLDYRWINRQGESVWINCRGTVIKDDKGRPFVMIGRVSDRLLQYLYNPLTKLFNKEKLFMDLKEKCWNSGYFMLLSIDNLRETNAKYGKTYGNKIVKTCAEILEKVESVQTVWHVDNDYFALYLHVETMKDALAEYHRIIERLAGICTVSAGVVPIDRELFGDEQSLYEAAEITLEKTKTMGEKTISFFSKTDHEKRKKDLLLLSELRQSVEKDCAGFYLCYQPQVKMEEYNMFGAEALLRYHSHTRGEVYPDEFIPLLEQYGLIHKVGLWVLKTALKKSCEWRKGLPDFHISVNFSILQLEDRKIGEKVLDILSETDMPGDALTIELTESVQLQEMSRYTDIFEQWHNAGIELSIDDFGTGYSSMSYLKKLKVNEIKIDRIFIQGLEEATYNYKLISNMVDFAKNNDIRICCEGVENVQELSVLERLSPNLVQGYLFAKPCKTEVFEQSFINKSMDSAVWRVK